MSIQLNDDENNAGDGEGVWSPDIEQCFQEALIMFPPCGRRKHILSEEGGGKMYGRNELIARFILMRTGKRRTRKQVSSHIQVLARRKAKTDVGGGGGGNVGVGGGGGGGGCGSTGSNGIGGGRNSVTMSVEPSSTASSTTNSTGSPTSSTHPSTQLLSNYATSIAGYDLWVDREIVAQKMRLVEFSAFIEQRNLPDGQRHCFVRIDYRLQRQPASPMSGVGVNAVASAAAGGKLESIDVHQIHDKFPDLTGPNGLIHRGAPDTFFLVKFWADLSYEFEFNIDDQNSFFSSQFETIDLYKDITCSTKACSYGLQVVEKVERIQPTYNSLNGRYCYSTNRSPMCKLMVQFIKKLHELPKREQMNSVLENFTVLQVITSESTNEILLCLAYVFEVSSSEDGNGPQHHIYRLTT